MPDILPITRNSPRLGMKCSDFPANLTTKSSLSCSRRQRKQWQRQRSFSFRLLHSTPARTFHTPKATYSHIQRKIIPPLSIREADSISIISALHINGDTTVSNPHHPTRRLSHSRKSNSPTICRTLFRPCPEESSTANSIIRATSRPSPENMLHSLTRQSRNSAPPGP